MSVIDIFVSGDGSDAASGLTSYANRVQTFTRARALAAALGAGNVPRFVIGQFDMSLGSSGVAFSTRLGTGIDANNVPDGWSMIANDPSLPWHFRDHRILSSTSDFVQVYTPDGGATFNVAKGGRTIPGMTDNAGTPSGVGTGIWAVTCGSSGIPIVQGVGDYALKVDRVWLGARPATLGSASALLTSQRAENEAWEAQNFSTLGQDGSHMWTQLTPGEQWTAAAYGPQANVIFVQCPKGNPATVYGGITVMVRRSSGFVGGGLGQVCPLTIENSNGWTIDSSVKVIGGCYGQVKIGGNCAGWRLEQRGEGLSMFYPAVGFALLSSSTQKTCTDFVIAPQLDTKTMSKPYYPIDGAHIEGGCDTIQFLAGGVYARGRIAGRTAAGELTYVRDPAHSAVGSVGTTSDISDFNIEADFSIYCGGAQYQRGFVFNGSNATLRRMTISAKVYDQSAPSQLDGEVRVVGAEFHRARQLIATHPDYDTSGVYTARFATNPTVQTRSFANTHPNGKNRDGCCLIMNTRGRQEVVDSLFNGTHAVGIYAQKVVSNNTTAPDLATESLVIARNVFINKNDPRGEQAAVCIDGRTSYGGAVHLINNTAIGYPASGGAQHVERDSYYRWTGPLESLGNALVDGGANSVKGGDGAGCAVNTGWRRYDSLADYRGSVNRQLV